MDAVKILGSLLSRNSLGSKKGGDILSSLLGGGGAGCGAGADALAALLGGGRGAKGGGLAALLAIVTAAQSRGGNVGAAATSAGGGNPLASILGELGGKGGLGSLLGGGSSSAPAQPSGGGGLGNLVGGLLGGGKTASPGAAGGGGLGGMLGSLLGGASSGSPDGGGLGDLLGSVLGQPGSGGGLGFAAATETAPEEAEQCAMLLIEAMCHAAKCDGHVDEREREAILGRVGELEPDEVAYIEGLLAGPTDLDAFVRRVPPGMAEQVYAFSLMAVELELPAEFEYFGRLARALGLDERTVGTIHDSLGQPRISL